MDGLDRGRRLLPSDDHPGFRIVDGLPVADRLVRHLVSQRVTDLRLVLHHLPGLIAHYFMDGSAWGARITYAYQERPLGSGGALAQAADFCTETVLLLPGVILTDFSLDAMAEAHRAAQADVTVALGTVQGARQRPYAVLDGRRRLTGYTVPRGGEPPPQGHFMDAGVYVVEPGVVQGLASDAVLDWSRDVMPTLVEEGRVAGWTSEAQYILGSAIEQIPLIQQGLADA
jgi:mannose-1-phosphate guanylyltransferase/phosphomannomutase